MKRSTRNVISILLMTIMIISPCFGSKAETAKKQHTLFPEIIVENNENIVPAGESGKFNFKIKVVDGMEADGKIVYTASEDDIIKINSDGTWTAKKPGVLCVNCGVEYSKEVYDKWAIEYPDEEFSVADYYVSIPVVVKPDTEEMLRLYNPFSGEHLYTSDINEKTKLIQLGWKDEGIGWKAPKNYGDPVYRLYNPYTGDHFYTLDSREKSALVGLGWKDEGIGWYSYNDYIDLQVPVLRQYNQWQNAHNHNFTTDEVENTSLTKNGWKEEGIAWYGIR